VVRKQPVHEQRQAIQWEEKQPSACSLLSLKIEGARGNESPGSSKEQNYAKPVIFGEAQHFASNDDSDHASQVDQDSDVSLLEVSPNHF